jgi:hypothetical protein
MVILFLLFVLVMAVLQLIFPAEMLMLGKRWQFKDGAEPSDAAITMARVSSLFAIIFVILAMFSSWGM